MKKSGLLRMAGTVLAFCIAAANTSTAQTTFTNLAAFDGTDGTTSSALVEGADGNLYGTTQNGGTGAACPYSQGCGTVFKMTPAGTLITLYNFCSQANCADGGFPPSALVLGTDGNFYGVTGAGGANAGCAYNCGTVFEITPTGTLTTLYNFCSLANCADGADPGAALVQGTDGNFYGTTLYGGANACADGASEVGCGTVFKITPAGALTALYSFCSQSGCADGVWPQLPLIQATDGNYYGATGYGGNSSCSSDGCGIIFRITPTGTLNTLYSFCSQANCTDGKFPAGALVQASDGNLYGTTVNGGSNQNRDCVLESCGTVFQITLSGSLTTIYNFCSQAKCVDGAEPFGGALVQGQNGNLYGTTPIGGKYREVPGDSGSGSVFEITTTGTLTTLYSFCKTLACPEGQFPRNGVIQASNGSFYGTTFEAFVGTHNYGTIFSLSGTTLTPATNVFPKTKVGKTSAAKKFMLTNKDGVVLTNFVFSTTGDFAVASNTCGTSLAVNAKCSIEVTFTPTQTGTRTGQLIVTDSGSNSPQIARLSGTGD